MAILQFNDESLYNQGVQKYENRLISPLNKFIDTGSVLVTYYQINDKRSTADRGFGAVQQWLGSDSPVRFNKIENFPISIPAPVSVTDGEEVPGVIDINSSFQIIIYPGTIAPMDNDMFIINHLQMIAIYRIADISYDNTTIKGFYQATARLEWTTQNDLDRLESQVVERNICKLEDFGTEVSPIISKDDYVYIRQLEDVRNNMIETYKSLYYNEMYDCFLASTNEGYIYDACLMDFISKHSLLCIPSSPVVTLCPVAVNESKFPYYYNRSIYHWIEQDAPMKYMTNFWYTSTRGVGYNGSIFQLYMKDDVRCVWPCTNLVTVNKTAIIDGRMFDMMHGLSDEHNAFEKILKMFATGKITGPKDIPLDIAEPLLDSCGDLECYFLTPIILYIINMSIKMR